MPGNDMTDVSQMPLPGGGQNTPASGSYGSGQTTADNLKKMIGLPPAQGGGQGQPSAPPISTTPASAKPSPTGGPFGLPAGITAPTAQPGTPANTPLAQPYNPVANAQTSQQKNIALLDMLTRNPDVSDDTREWATIALKRLIAKSAQ